MAAIGADTTGAVVQRGTARLIAKRAFDVVVGTVLAIVATPVILLLALGSFVALGSWPFFTQDRVGRGGRHFRFVKIRTMPKTTHAYALKHHLTALDLPRFARWLRDRHLDELPQLWLVPFGRMSLVGPRPKMPDEHEPVDADYMEFRLQVPQGCTCLWQIGEHTDALPSDSPQYDLWYVAHGGLRLDLWILWRTALTLIGLGKAVNLREVPAWVRGRGWVAEHVRTARFDSAGMA